MVEQAEKVEEVKSIEPTDAEKRIYRYWQSNIKRAKKKQPVKKWEQAEKRFAAKPPKEGEDGRPFVNDYRKLHEASMSFLDQQEPNFKITPAEAWISDMDAVKRAECDAAYLKRVWKEQRCQQAESRKLNEALLINSGSTLVLFDVKKWMPSQRYLPARDVLKDPDCGGLLENASWDGYQEDVPIEQFRSWHTDLSEEIFKRIVSKAGSVLTEGQREEAAEVGGEEDVAMYRTIKVTHIFARNAAAIRKEEKKEGDKVEVPSKNLAEELQLDTPRRYMQFVDGWPAAMVDEDYWPLDLDHDEFPISHLQFNQVPNDLYGFTDYQQMERLDLLGDDMMYELGVAAFWAAVTKFGGTANMKVEKPDLDNFLNDPRTSFLSDLLTPDGKPKLVPLERGKINPAQMSLYQLVADQTKEASALSEILSSSDVQTFKDVTAIAARIADANMHQRVNRRLNGPWGYEQSIAEDAIKMLEVAHQFVPKRSIVTVREPTDTGEIDPVTQQPITEESEVPKELPWPEALQAIAAGGDLIKLGVDAIVGPELAQYWPYKLPPEQWRLNTKVVVEPGSTRSITRQQQAAVMKQLYVEIFQPFYAAIQRVDLMRDFLEFIGRLAQVPNIEAKLPSVDELKQWIEQQQQMQQQMMEQEMRSKGEGGGQPLNAPQGESQPSKEQA